MLLPRPALRPPCALPQDATAWEAAKWMKVRSTCAVVVTAGGRPVGLVTDHDLVTQVLARGRRPSQVKLQELCEGSVVTIQADEPPAVAARRMREQAARWLVVVDQHGRPVGVVTIEDLFAQFSRDLGRLSGAVDRLREPAGREAPPVHEIEEGGDGHAG